MAKDFKIRKAHISLVILIILSSFAVAQDDWVIAITTLVCDILVDALKDIVGALAAVVFVYAGIEYVISQDDPGKRKQARDMMVYAIVGIILVGIASTIISSVPGFSSYGCT